MEFKYKIMKHWPPLAWLAECPANNQTISINHGELVEARERWFIEGIWAGEFTEGNFDKTDIVSGSGAKVTEDKVCFVSSGSNIDRLHSLQKGDVTIVSNSLCCLLSWIDAVLETTYLNYMNDFAKYRYTVFGCHSHVFPSTGGLVRLTYFANLLWDGKRLAEHEKPYTERQFLSFDEYAAFLRETMKVVADNATDKQRSNPLKFTCSLSNGYDSATVAAIAQSVCEVEAFTFEKNSDGIIDSGAEIAAKLDISCHVLDRNAVCGERLADVPFIAGSGSVGDVVFKSAEDILRGKVLLLGGPGGDTSWDKNAKMSKNKAVGGGALLGLTEFRLWAGVINCSVPMWSIRNIRDIISINNSKEMTQWDTGGKYTRPICRRIVEEAGVPRTLFGIGKRGVSFLPGNTSRCLCTSSREDFIDWLDKKYRRALKNGEKPLVSPRIARFLDKIIPLVEKYIDKLMPLLNRRGFWKVQKTLVSGKRMLNKPLYHYKYVVHWAVERAIQRYETVASAGPMHNKYRITY